MITNGRTYASTQEDGQQEATRQQGSDTTTLEQGGETTMTQGGDTTMMQGDETTTREQGADVELASILENPQRYYGQEMTVSGAVGQVIEPWAFVMVDRQAL